MIFDEWKEKVCEIPDCENFTGCEHAKTKEETFVKISCDVCKSVFTFFDGEYDVNGVLNHQVDDWLDDSEWVSEKGIHVCVDCTLDTRGVINAVIERKKKIIVEAIKSKQEEVRNTMESRQYKSSDYRYFDGIYETIEDILEVIENTYKEVRKMERQKGIDITDLIKKGGGK